LLWAAGYRQRRYTNILIEVPLKKLILLFSLLLITKLNGQCNINFPELNDLYYNIYDYNFNGFSAEVDFELIAKIKESLKDEIKIDALNKLTFSVVLYSKDSIVFNSSGIDTTGDEDFDRGLSQIIYGAEKTVKGVLLSWATSCFTPAFEPEKFVYNCSDDSSLTIVNYEREGSKVIIFLNNITNIDSIYISNKIEDIKVHPFYEKTDYNKMIIKSLVTSVNNLLEVYMEIDYRDFDKIKIPERIKVSSKTQNNFKELSFKLNNIVLK